MILSRRQFFKSSAATAAAAPLTIAFGDSCEAATHSAIDLSMGNPEGAIRLNFNENALGPSPLAIEGAKAGVDQGFRYALGGMLRPLIAEHHGIDPDWVLMGTGSTELQRLAPVSVLKEGGNVVSGFETWGGGLVVAEHMGAEVKRVPLIRERGYAFDIPAMLAQVDTRTKIFLVVTPNNPTGALTPYEDLKLAADSLPKDVLFIIDEAYADYLPDGTKTGLDLIKEGYENVLVTRTFSKAHAMAGLRSGYGIAHPDILREIAKYGCGPAATSIAVFGAVQGALADLEHARKSRAHVESCRAYFEGQAADLGVTAVSGVPPFILYEMGNRSAEIVAALRERKILINHAQTWNLPNHIRISYGLAQENEKFIEAFRELL